MGKKKIVTKIETTETAAPAESSAVKKTSAKKQVINGTAYIHVSYNNTIIAIGDSSGNIIAQSSAGLLGFRGSKKSTPYAANLVAKDVVEKAKKYNLTNLKIVVRGIGPARESAVRGLAGSGMNITGLMDATPVAHNGVKSKKPRRV